MSACSWTPPPGTPSVGRWTSYATACLRWWSGPGTTTWPGNRSNPSAVSDKLGELECTARELAVSGRRYVVHNRGEPVIEVGNVRFGLEFRELEQRPRACRPPAPCLARRLGMAFDCFERAPHFHYGPRNKDIAHLLGPGAVHIIDWTLDQAKRAGSGPGILASPPRWTDLVLLREAPRPWESGRQRKVAPGVHFT